MNETLLWGLAIALMAIGFAGIVLPALPGVPLMFAGMLLGASIDGFERIGWLSLTVLGVLTAITVVIDVAAAMMGAQRVGASRRAIWGAALGAVIGLFFGLIGLFLGPFVGAVIGELTVQRSLGRAGRVGIATWIGLLFGALLKVAIAFAMVGLFVFAFFF